MGKFHVNRSPESEFDALGSAVFEIFLRNARHCALPIAIAITMVIIGNQFRAEQIPRKISRNSKPISYEKSSFAVEISVEFSKILDLEHWEIFCQVVLILNDSRNTSY